MQFLFIFLINIKKSLQNCENDFSKNILIEYETVEELKMILQIHRAK